MMDKWVVAIWFNDNVPPVVSTYRTWKNAVSDYKRVVDPKNPHSRTQYALIAEIKHDYLNKLKKV